MISSKIDNLIGNLADNAAPVKPLKSPLLRAMGWIAIAIIYTTTLVMYLGFRDNVLILLEDSFYLSEVIFAFAIAVTGFIAASYLSVPDSYQKPYIRWIPIIPFTLLTSLLLALLVNPVTGENVATNDNTFECAIDMAVFSIFPLIMTFYVIKKAATTKRYWSGMVAGLASASVSYIALRLIEANDVIEHIVFWHFVPMLIIVALTTLLSKFILKW